MPVKAEHKQHELLNLSGCLLLRGENQFLLQIASPLDSTLHCRLAGSTQGAGQMARAQLDALPNHLKKHIYADDSGFRVKVATLTYCCA